MKCGGFKPPKQIDDAAKQVAMDMKPKIEAKLNATYTTFEPTLYTTQVVAGTNYLIKIKVDGDQYIHAKIFKPLPCNGTELELLTASAGHTADDQLK